MAQTCQMVRDNGTLNWNSTFQAAQTTETQSAVFMKKLLAVAVSNILYLRAIFPEKAFGNRKLEDLDLKILSEGSKIEGACQVIKWMRGCFEALEKKYLREIQLAVYLNENEPDNAVESYVFRIAYNNEHTSVTCNDAELISTSPGQNSSKEIRRATLALLRTTIQLTHVLDPLPDRAFLGMKLLYYDDVTPPDYEPAGFQSCDVPSYTFDGEPLNMKVGEVNTKFHTMKVRVKTQKMQFEDQDVEPLVHPSSVTTTQSTPKSELSKSETQSEQPPENGVTDRYQSLPSSPLPMEMLPSTSSAIAPESPTATSEKSDNSFHSMGGQVRCPCDDFEDDGLMVQCMSCGYWQHGFCFAVKNDSDAPDKHFCHICGDPNNPKRMPTDFFLHALDITNKKNLCIWRRTLSTCLHQRTLTLADLRRQMNLTPKNASSLMERLEVEGFVTSGEGRLKYKKTVQKDVLMSVGIPMYLTRQKSSSFSSKNSANVNEMETEKPVFCTNYDDKEIASLVENTKNLSVVHQKNPLPKTTKMGAKRKQISLLNVNLSDSQEPESCSSHTSVSKKKKKSSSSSRGLEI